MIRHRQGPKYYVPAESSLRRGAVMIWFIVALPVLLTLLCVVLEVGNLYLARSELQNAMEAAAQAAVKDWAENGNIPQARNVGNAYAMANTINGEVVDLTTVDDNAFPLNQNGGNSPNQNNSNDGVLVFGAITNDTTEFVFNCCTAPQPCGAGSVLIDASGSGNLGNAQLNQWGIRYLFDPAVAGVTITSVRITLNGGHTFIPGTFGISPITVTNDPGNKVRDNDSSGIDSAPDLFGMAVADITEAFSAGDTVLTFTFAAAGGGDTVFDPGDRFRFAADVDNLDGDGVGQVGTQAEVLITFDDGSTASGALIDTSGKGQFGPPPPSAPCARTGVYNATFMSLSVFPRPNLIPDLPCPPNASGNANNGQSYVQLQRNGGGGSPNLNNAFAVRAQATYPVPSICCDLFGLPIGPFTVTAKADALYDCSTETPRLFHLEQLNFLCANPACP